MPFVNFIKEEVKNRGVDAMELTTAFSEKEVLQNNIAYVCKYVLDRIPKKHKIFFSFLMIIWLKGI